MKITQIPKSYTGVYTPIEYQIESSKPEQVIELSVLNKKGETMGIKHLVGERNYRVNIAPYVRRELDVVPQRGKQTGFYQAPERSMEARIKIALLESGANAIFSPLSIFTAASGEMNEQKVLSSAPNRVEIAENECDEIAFIAPNRVAVATIILEGVDGSKEIVIGESGSGTQNNLIGHRCSNGITLFLLNMESLLKSINPQVEGRYGRLTLEIAVKEDELDSKNGAQNNEIDSTTLREQMEVVARRVYRVVSATDDSSRVCWANQMGAVERYTFTAEKDQTLMVNKSRAYTEQGYKTVDVTEQTLTTLRSQIEPEALIRWLSGVVGSPRVWREQAGRFVPIDVVTSSVMIRESNPRSMTITVRDSYQGVEGGGV